MRAKRTTQMSLFDPQSIEHPIADDLKTASAWLDAHPELLDAVIADLHGGTGSSRGRHGLTGETVLRCAVLLHLRQASYRGLAFILKDSLSTRRFARLDPARRPPGKSVLQATVGTVGAATWERLGRCLLAEAQAPGVERAETVRVDSTAVETHILKPADSRLLHDGVRVLTRLLREAGEALGRERIEYRNHCRAAKRRALEIPSRRGAKRRAGSYRKLLRLTAQTMGYVEAAMPRVRAARAPWSRACIPNRPDPTVHQPRKPFLNNGSRPWPSVRWRHRPWCKQPFSVDRRPVRQSSRPKTRRAHRSIRLLWDYLQSACGTTAPSNSEFTDRK